MSFKFALILGILSLLFLTIGGVGWAADLGWETEAAINLSESGDIRQPAIAISQFNELAVAWSGISETKRIFLNHGTPLTKTTLIRDDGNDVWAPTIMYTGTQLSVAWMEGDYRTPKGTLYQHDIGSEEPPQALFSSLLYGYTAPRLQVGANGQHLILAAADNKDDFSKCDMYYLYRPAGSDSWFTPTQIITNTQVSPSSSVGGIWYPDAALSPDGETIYLIWEQTIDFRRSIWFAMGNWQSQEEQFNWQDPLRLSLEGIKAVRPKIAFSSSGDVHVAWVEQTVFKIDDAQDATLQYIKYRRLSDNLEWHPSLENESLSIDPNHVQVNTYRPTWSAIDIASDEESVCIAWHGYRADPGATGNEEIFMNCSHDKGKNWSDLITNASSTPIDFLSSPLW